MSDMVNSSIISNLASNYERVIPLNEKFSLVAIKNRFGVVGNFNGDIVVGVKWDKYSIFETGSSCIVALVDSVNGETILVNGLNGRTSKVYNGIYNISKVINGIIVLGERVVGNTRQNTMILAEHNYKEIMTSKDINAVYDGSDNSCRVFILIKGVEGSVDNTYYSVNETFELRITSMKRFNL